MILLRGKLVLQTVNILLLYHLQLSFNTAYLFLQSPARDRSMFHIFFGTNLPVTVLRHPNLPVVKDYFITSGRYYLVMEYIDGKDLDTVMRSYGVEGVPPDLVIAWAKELLQVLDYLHN